MPSHEMSVSCPGTYLSTAENGVRWHLLFTRTMTRTWPGSREDRALRLRASANKLRDKAINYNDKNVAAPLESNAASTRSF